MSYECLINVLIMSCNNIIKSLIYRYISKFNRTFSKLVSKTDICPINVLMSYLLAYVIEIQSCNSKYNRTF